MSFIGLFIDVGTNYSVLDHTNLSFLYEDVLTHGPNSDGQFVSFVSCCELSILTISNIEQEAMNHNSLNAEQNVVYVVMQIAVYYLK